MFALFGVSQKVKWFSAQQQSSPRTKSSLTMEMFRRNTGEWQTNTHRHTTTA